MCEILKSIAFPNLPCQCPCLLFLVIHDMKKKWWIDSFKSFCQSLDTALYTFFKSFDICTLPEGLNGHFYATSISKPLCILPKGFGAKWISVIYLP